MNNPESAVANTDGRVKIEYYGLSCFLITSSNGTRIVTDSFIADRNMHHVELRKEPVDVVSCQRAAFSRNDEIPAEE